MPVKKPVRMAGASSLVQDQMMDASFGFALVGQDKREGKSRVSKRVDASIIGW
jgi:hypothetical protein